MVLIASTDLPTTVTRFDLGLPKAPSAVTMIIFTARAPNYVLHSCTSVLYVCYHVSIFIWILHEICILAAKATWVTASLSCWRHSLWRHLRCKSIELEIQCHVCDCLRMYMYVTMEQIQDSCCTWTKLTPSNRFSLIAVRPASISRGPFDV